ncbi:MAG: ATP-grasp domain-containing protein [Thiohalobacterales bacterium]|nr:ATP-grasp domain-containing protein [Thiohalobacterales bacterium]
MNDQQANPRLLLIAPPNSYRTAAFIGAARRNQVDVLVASEGHYSLVSEVAAGLHIDLQDPAALQLLLEASRERPFAGVVATDDATVELGSRIAAELGLPHNPPAAARFSRRKDLSRKALADAGLGVPRFRLLDLDHPLTEQSAGFPLPAVVKPLVLSASRGVIRVDTPGGLAAACARIESILAGEPLSDRFEARHLLLESFVAGAEVALEGLLRRGRLDVLAIFDKPDPLEGPYFEETYYITPSRHDRRTQQQLHDCTQAACAALGLREGPVHAELRITADGPVIMEVAARTIGGECARLLHFGTGYGLEELVILHAIGRPLHGGHTGGGAGVLMIPIPAAGILRRIEGIGRARAVPGITDVLVTIRDGYELVPLPEGGSYLGFMFAECETPAAAEAALREAHAELNIVVAPAMQIEDARIK